MRSRRLGKKPRLPRGANSTNMAVEVEYWPTQDPTAVEGSRDQRLDAYRAVRDELMRRIRARFSVDRAGDA